jgi:cell division protein FtsW
MASRAERTVTGEWWWTVDRYLLAGLAALMLSGIVLLMAGGPPVADRLGLSTFHFVNRQVFYLIPAIILMLITSFLSPRMVRRAALLLFGFSLVLVIAALLVGTEIKGARRWLSIMGVGIQPSEFLKPAFVIMAAWAFSAAGKHSDKPGTVVAMLLLPLTILPLILQPDFGQTMLITLVWMGLFFIAGLHIFWVLGLGGAGLLSVLTAYKFVPHVRERIERFMDKSTGDSFQVDVALESFANGGWLGQGPGEGTVKRILPDAHTDFIFAVTAEEFGIITCLALLALFAFIVLRGFVVSRKQEDPFTRLAIVGLVMLFGIQASINMMVNVHLMPAKGMTLPFISYGGSSLVSLGIAMGFLLALTRKRPQSGMRQIIYPQTPSSSVVMEALASGSLASGATA